MLGNKLKLKSSLWLFSSGIIVTCLGVYVWLHPEGALRALALCLGLILLVVGIAYFIFFIKKSRSSYLTIGLLNTLVGLILTFNIGVTVETLPVMLAFWSIFIGVVQTSTSYHNQKKGDAWWWLFVSGVLGILFGFLMIMYPAIGMIAITVIIGFYMILNGVLGVVECDYCNIDDKTAI